MAMMNRRMDRSRGLRGYKDTRGGLWFLFAIGPRLHGLGCEHELVGHVLATTAEDDPSARDSERREGKNTYPSSQALHLPNHRL
jgi:hypothetical protein